MKYREDLKIEFKAEIFGSVGTYHVLMYRISPDQDLTYIEERSFLGFKYKVKKKFDLEKAENNCLEQTTQKQTA